MAVDDWTSREHARRLDALEAKLELARSLIRSTRAELQFQGCHAMWELACRPENHEGFTGFGFELLHRSLLSEELRVRAVAAAALWTLAEVDGTLARLPVAQLAPALLCSALAHGGHAPPKLPHDAMPELDNLQLGQIRVHRALSSTGRTLSELQQWPVGALYAIARTEARRAVIWRAPHLLPRRPHELRPGLLDARAHPRARRLFRRAGGAEGAPSVGRRAHAAPAAQHVPRPPLEPRPFCARARSD